MQQKKQWKLLDLLNTTMQYLLEKGVDNPRLNAEELLGKALDLNRVQLYVSFDRPISETELDLYRSLIKRRSQHEPLQHILGQTEFMGYPFIVNPNVLIPRPETEILVEEVLKTTQQTGQRNPSILDIGTGSGCIAISLALQLPGSHILAIDISKSALDIARQNCQLNNISLNMFESDHTKTENTAPPITFAMYDILSPWPSSFQNRFDIMVSNPPYVTKTEMEQLQPEVRDFEPQGALTDFNDGLTYYKRIFELVSERESLQCKYLFLEMSGSQPDKIVSLARTYSFYKIDIIPDLNKIERVLKIEVSNE